jgi:hypothetical protein
MDYSILTYPFLVMALFCLVYGIEYKTSIKRYRNWLRDDYIALRQFALKQTANAYICWSWSIVWAVMALVSWLTHN